MSRMKMMVRPYRWAGWTWWQWRAEGSMMRHDGTRLTRRWAVRAVRRRNRIHNTNSRQWTVVEP